MQVKDGWAGKGDQKAVTKGSAVGTLAHDVMMKRGWEGIGTEGTERARTVFWFRIIATWTQVGRHDTRMVAGACRG